MSYHVEGRGIINVEREENDISEREEDEEWEEKEGSHCSVTHCTFEYQNCLTWLDNVQEQEE